MYMSTVDIKAAYHSVPVHAQDRDYFGLRWQFDDHEVLLHDNFLYFWNKGGPLHLFQDY